MLKIIHYILGKENEAMNSLTQPKHLTKPTAAELQRLIEWHLKYSLSKRVCEADSDHLFTALAMAVRDLCIDGMFQTAARHEKEDPKRVYYLSLEYLLGRLLPNNLYNLELMDLLKDIHSFLLENNHALL